MSDIVTESHVFVDCKAATIDEVLAFFAEKTVELGFADDANAIFEAFKARHTVEQLARGRPDAATHSCGRRRPAA